MDTVYSLTQAEACTQASGKTINNTDLGRKAGIIIRLNTPATSLTARNPVPGGLNSKADTMRATLSMVNSMATANITSPTLENYTRVNLRKIIWKGRALCSGPISHAMRVILRKEKWKARGQNISPQVINISASGRMTCNMVLVSCSVLRTKPSAKANGPMASADPGSIHPNPPMSPTEAAAAPSKALNTATLLKQASFRTPQAQHSCALGRVRMLYRNHDQCKAKLN